MIVNKNAPTWSNVKVIQEDQFTHDISGEQSNIPIRLEIASRLVVNMVQANRFTGEALSIAALELADKLIKAHNETCGE